MWPSYILCNTGQKNHNPMFLPCVPDECYRQWMMTASLAPLRAAQWTVCHAGKEASPWTWTWRSLWNRATAFLMVNTVSLQPPT